MDGFPATDHVDIQGFPCGRKNRSSCGSGGVRTFWATVRIRKNRSSGVVGLVSNLASNS